MIAAAMKHMECGACAYYSYSGRWLNIVNDNIGSAFISTSKLNDSILWHARLGHVCFKRMQDMSKDGLIPSFDIDTEKFGIIHETTAPYTPQQNGISERKNRVLKEMVNSMLSYSGMRQGFWGEAMKPNLNYRGCKVVVRLPNQKLKTLGERGIECIFVGYAEHSKAFRSLHVLRNPSLRFQIELKTFRVSVVQEVVQQPEPELRKSKRNRTPKNFGPEFQLYLIEGTTDEVSDQHSYCFNVEDDPKTFDEAMKFLDVAFWKESITDEMDSIMDGTVEKFKARLVIQGFRQKSGRDYFDTYALVARISTIRLLIAMASIHSLIIHQMDVKIAFLNADKCIYSKFDESGKGVIICLYVDDMLIFGTDLVQVDLTKEFLSSRFSMKDMGEVDVILGIRIKHESNGMAISQSHYIEKVLKKFNYFECTPVSTPVDKNNA
ncbi:zinc finger, CCHC-type containing protein [Tanacetum coccineum]